MRADIFRACVFNDLLSLFQLPADRLLSAMVLKWVSYSRWLPMLVCHIKKYLCPDRLGRGCVRCFP